MSTDTNPDLGRLVRRGLLVQLLVFVTILVASLVAIPSARSHRASALLVIVCGIGITFVARGLRAASVMLQVTDPPSPRWPTRVAAMAYVLGSVLVLTGALLFIGIFQ
jgi:hypothetical protein